MSADESQPVVPWYAYREPPNGLSNEWDGNFRALVDPVSIAIAFTPDRARRGDRDLLAVWHEKLHVSQDRARIVLGFLHGVSPRTWTAGWAILTAVSPIKAALWTTLRFLDNPTPTRSGDEATATTLRANVADKLCQLKAVPLMDDLAAAVVADCASQRGQPARVKRKSGKATGKSPTQASELAAFDEFIDALQGPKMRSLLKELWQNGNRPTSKYGDVLKVVYSGRSLAGRKTDNTFDKLIGRTNDMLSVEKWKLSIERSGNTLRFSGQATK